MAKGLSNRGVIAIHRYTNERLERELDRAWYIVAESHHRVIADGYNDGDSEAYKACTLYISRLDNWMSGIRRRAEWKAEAERGLARIKQELAEQENRRQLAELQPLGLTCTPPQPLDLRLDEVDGEQNSEAWARKWVDGLRHPR